MGEKRNFAALEWVLSEISDTLKEARQSLEAYVEDPKDSTRIRFCLTHIHQVHGSLQMVEFHGAALLAEEMEQTAQAIMDNLVASIPEAQEVLMRGLLQLPIFLEHVKSSKEDNPVRVMPLLNDLRAVRKQSYLSETNLFSPDLSSIASVHGEKHPVLNDKAKLLQVLTKLREMYQFAAASVLRGIKVDENLNYLDKVFGRLETIARGTPSYPTWEVAAALIEALRRDDVELTVAVRGLLRYVSRELRILGENAPAAFENMPRESLLKNLLYYVARAEDGSAKVARVKEKYKLNTSLISKGDTSASAADILQAPDAGAIRSVVVALQDELSTIKQVLDVSLSGQGSADQLKEILPSVKRVADTLAVLGIGDLRKQMLEQCERLEKISEANSIDDKQLMHTANKIIEIEHRLRAIAKSAGKRSDLGSVNERDVEIDNAKAAVVEECAAGLLKCKESIIDYISSQWDKQHLLDVGAMLNDIRGGLNMIPLRRPAAIVNSCSLYIQEQLLDKEQNPSFQALESLADAMASVEYYLERLMEDLHEDSDSMLDIAEESVANLGYDVEQQEPIRMPGESASSLEPGLAVPEVIETEPEVIEEFVPQPQPSVDKAAFANELVIEPDEVAEQEPVVEPEALVEPEPEKVAEAVPEPVVAEEFESEIDDEIIEIFIEEAGEVHETLSEYYPQWRSKDSDQDALVVVRRAFHTLKGSGRMVEAFDIATVAWSVENMLNRVIDRTIRVEPHIFHLVDAVIAVIPTLVEAFEKRLTNPVKDLTSQYEAWGHEISEGGLPDILVDPIPLYGQHEPRQVAPVESGEALEETAKVTEPEALLEDGEDNEVDSVLREIFSQESISHLETVDGFIRQMENDAPLYSVPSDSLQRALHTLKGSAKMAQVWPIAEITEPLEQLTKELIAFQVGVDEDMLQLIRDASEYTRIGIRQIDAGEKIEIPKIEQFLARTQELRDLAVGHLITGKYEETGVHKVDPRMLSLVMAEEMALLMDADKILDRCQQREHGCDDELRELIAELSVLKEGARQANLADMSSLAAMLGEAYKLSLDDNIPQIDQFFSVLRSGHEALLDMVDAVAAGQNVQSPGHELLGAVKSLLDATQQTSPGELETLDSAVEEIPNIDSEGSGASLEQGENLAGEYAVDFGEEPETSLDDTGEFIPEPIPQESDTLFEEAISFEVEDSGEEEISFDLDETHEETEEISFESLEEFSLQEQPEAADRADSPAFDSDLQASEFDETTDEAAAVSDLLAQDLGITDDTASHGLPGDDHGEIGLEPADSQDGVSLKSHETEEEITPEKLESEAEDPEITDVISGELIEEATDSTEREAEQELDSTTSGLEITEPLIPEIVEREGELPAELSAGGAVSTHEDLPQTVPEEAGAAEEEILSSGAGQERVSEAEEDVTSAQKVNEGEIRSSVIPGLIDRIDTQSDDFDHDILEVFVEEADELVEGLDEAIHSWESNWSDVESLEEIKRILHTLKGGARLAGLVNLGELTHDYETMLIEMGEDLSDVDDKFFSSVHAYQDRVLNAVRGVKAFIDGEYDLGELETMEEAVDEPTDTADGNNETEPEIEAKVEPEPEDSKSDEAVDQPQPEPDIANVLTFKPKVKAKAAKELEPAEFVMPTVSGGGQTAAASVALKKAGPQEMVKVSSELLEELVNLAGETSINRSRLEQYVNDFGFALDEVDSTLARLQDQLRRLDIETEAQILFRQEQMEAHDDFDPLEMDRYSHLQQLARSLIESASDLTDLKSDLGDKIKVTETLLIQQSRINTTLQEGLMRSRMVPFSRMVPRLRRIVRQVASELGKNVSFELDNVEGELDRSVLERMVSPFEHMLRNAVDHGIESPEDRMAAGKSEAGRIVLTLSREGGDVIIRLADDGRGIDLKRVRDKAIERELMSPDAELSDHDIMQFILHAGFSTAEKVSQISGRGVGMDVVSAEIKQLGGAVTINSSWGKGTEFVIRLPFTLSVNRALMVTIGQDQYAVPLSSIEGIVRVSPFELEHYYANPEAQFEYANENYHVRYLGSLLYKGSVPNLEGHVLPLPVLLVRSAEHTMALQVDAVMGSREIVVKSLGQQFSAVPGLSGATVMGDGSVVVILDPHALVRQEIAQATLRLIDGGTDDSVPLNVEEENRVKTIMVVDDSVTVRKVTTRFLEREGFDVVTAKDGVDALRILQDQLPDLMLLDIEMPRMDGFEVAKTVRATKRWEKLPIIMITSRTGDKHREHALSLGVNNYLGKPYQEDILLDAIGEILDSKARQH